MTIRPFRQINALIMCTMQYDAVFGAVCYKLHGGEGVTFGELRASMSRPESF